MTFSVICLSAMSVADELTLMTLAKTAATTVSTIIEWKITIATPVDVKRQKHSGLLDQKTAFSHILKRSQNQHAISPTLFIQCGFGVNKM